MVGFQSVKGHSWTVVLGFAMLTVASATLLIQLDYSPDPLLLLCAPLLVAPLFFPSWACWMMTGVLASAAVWTAHVLDDHAAASMRSTTLITVMLIIQSTVVRRVVAHRERLYERLVRAQKLEAIGTLAAGVAHDFNNSLTAIVNFAEVTKLGLPQDSKEIQYIEHILEASKQAASTTRGLLTFTGKRVSTKASKDMCRFLKRSVRFLCRVLRASIDISLRIPDDASFVCEIDEAQLQQVLLNLVVNARDAMPGGGKIVISVELDRRRTGFVLMTIADNGMGMSQDVKERIFDPFFTTKARGCGTGLGMSIVHGIIEEHGGTIEVESSEGQGTRVKIFLPVSPSAEMECGPDGIAGLNGRGHLILLAEDDDNVRRAIASQLETAGFSVIQTRDGQDTLDAFEEHHESVQLLILDVDLPAMTGICCLQRIRERAPDVPAILISGLPLSEPKHENAIFLRKPFGESELMNSIRTLPIGPSWQRWDVARNRPQPSLNTGYPLHSLHRPQDVAVSDPQPR